jgi:hypothetical protein
MQPERGGAEAPAHRTRTRRRPRLTWWGEAPEPLYALDEAAGGLNPASGYTKPFAEPRYAG